MSLKKLHDIQEGRLKKRRKKRRKKQQGRREKKLLKNLVDCLTKLKVLLVRV